MGRQALDAERFLLETLLPDGVAGDEAGRLVIARDPGVTGGMGLQTLGPDDLMVAVVPHGGRRRMRRTLEREGLVARGAWLVLAPGAPRALLSLDATAGAARARFAAELGCSRVLQLLLRSERHLLEELAPGVALAYQHPDARAPFEWLGAPLGAVQAVSAGWHDPAEGLVVQLEGGIAKTSRPGARRDPSREADALRRLGAGASAAGARIPRVTRSGPAGGRVVLVEERLPGSQAAGVLRAQPRRLGGLLDGMASWLGRWHEETRVVRALEPADVDRLVREPGRIVAGLVPHGVDYVARIEARAQALVGRAVPLVATHNDLTTWNVLVGPGGLAVVDWEDAAPEGLPLSDLEYLAVDAVAAARRLPRERAFELCGGAGADGELARRLREGVRARLGLSPELAELARHACWMLHARNEAERGGPAASRPFAAIASALAKAAGADAR